MLDKNTFESYFCPLGLKATVTDVMDDENIRFYTVRLSGFNGKGGNMAAEIGVTLPIPDKKYGRILQIEGSGGSRDRIVCNKAIPNPLDVDSAQTKKLSIRTWRGTVIDALNDITSEALMDLYFGGEAPDAAIIEQRMQTWFNTAPHILDVSLDNEMQIESACEALLIDFPEENMSHNNRVFPKEWLGMIDPCSTPASNKINQVYRLTHGTKVEGNTVIPSGNLFCSTIYNNAIALNLGPRRAYLLRTTFENSVPLVQPEEPKIAPPKNQIDGVHLYTAIMHLDGITFEDCIAVSASAAAKMMCVVKKRETVRSVMVLHASVKEGDVVEPGAKIAEDEAGQAFYARKIKAQAIVTQVEQTKVIMHGMIGYVIRISLSSIYSLQNGDKLSNRGAGKGVVRIVPDQRMPLDQTGRRVDVCVGPESIYGRRSMNSYWEMMAHKHIDAGGTVDPSYETLSPSFEELAKSYGEKTQLYLRGIDLPEKTYCGEIYWIRLNKHARDAISCKGTNSVTNQYNLRVDDARTSGQRMDLAKMIAFRSRGMDHISKYIVQNNTVGLNRLKELLGVFVDAEELDEWNKSKNATRSDEVQTGDEKSSN